MRRRIHPSLRLPNRLKLGASILEARRAVGLTQERLGQRLGLKGRAIYRWERNETAPSGRHRRALIREIHLLNPQAALNLQAALTAKTGKSYTVIGEPSIENATMNAARNDNSKSPGGPFTTPTLQVSGTTEHTSSVSQILEIAVLKMADELDLSPRRIRRALSHLLERLRDANLTLETVHVELSQLLARESSDR